MGLKPHRVRVRDPCEEHEDHRELQVEAGGDSELGEGGGGRREVVVPNEPGPILLRRRQHVMTRCSTVALVEEQARQLELGRPTAFRTDPSHSLPNPIQRTNDPLRVGRRGRWRGGRRGRGRLRSGCDPGRCTASQPRPSLGRDSDDRVISRCCNHEARAGLTEPG